jgi:hypothetical protein
LAEVLLVTIFGTGLLNWKTFQACFNKRCVVAVFFWMHDGEADRHTANPTFIVVVDTIDNDGWENGIRPLYLRQLLKFRCVMRGVA